METTAKIPRVVIVVPCYNEQEVLPISSKRLSEILAAMVEHQLASDDSRVLYVDDGSRDNTWQEIEKIHEVDNTACGIRFAANRGHQNAVLAGIDTAVDKLQADAVISIDADLQDNPGTIFDMVRLMGEGHDVVLGVRRKRDSDSWFKRTTAQGFYRLMKRLGVNIVYNHADYRLLSRRAAQALQGYKERNMFLRGVVAQMGFNQATVEYDRTERLAGETKYPLGKMLNFATDGITSFSVKPVRMVLTLGLVFIFITLLQLGYVLWAYFSHKAVSGWSSLMLSLWFIGGCILVALGIIGEYIGKIYLEAKQRPRYYIEKELGLEKTE